jgi:hypothetical protein
VKRRTRLKALVEQGARQGLEVARDGLGRLKETTAQIKATTAHLVEEVRERIAGSEAPTADAHEAETSSDGTGGGVR